MTSQPAMHLYVCSSRIVMADSLGKRHCHCFSIYSKDPTAGWCSPVMWTLVYTPHSYPLTSLLYLPISTKKKSNSATFYLNWTASNGGPIVYNLLKKQWSTSLAHLRTFVFWQTMLLPELKTKKQLEATKQIVNHIPRTYPVCTWTL